MSVNQTDLFQDSALIDDTSLDLGTDTNSKVQRILVMRYLSLGESIILRPGRFGGFYKVVELNGRNYKSTGQFFEVSQGTGELVYKGSSTLNSVFYVKNHHVYISMLRGHSYRDYQRVDHQNT